MPIFRFADYRPTLMDISPRALIVCVYDAYTPFCRDFVFAYDLRCLRRCRHDIARFFAAPIFYAMMIRCC